MVTVTGHEKVSAPKSLGILAVIFCPSNRGPFCGRLPRSAPSQTVNFFISALTESHATFNQRVNDSRYREFSLNNSQIIYFSALVSLIICFLLFFCGRLQYEGVSLISSSKHSLTFTGIFIRSHHFFYMMIFRSTCFWILVNIDSIC